MYVQGYMFSDIDECSSGTHDCSADVACNNIKGSYLCSCLAAYSGDGRLCEGEMFRTANIGEESAFFRKQFQSINIASMYLIKPNRIMLYHTLNKQH